eukprot:TRINITY_DN1140_c0_g1_i3.p1 TRINITY_DN1140_c0_g1~~TRINITY_DN1140_c0_g1_i3.p1  ORF type:complete len:587 (-),score=195.25 TRINITY_DN1140_c0_g1_i3:142-1791(-)
MPVPRPAAAVAAARTVGSVVAAPARAGAGDDLRNLEAAALQELNRAHGAAVGTSPIDETAVPDGQAAARLTDRASHPVEPTRHLRAHHRRESSAADAAAEALANEVRDERNEKLIVDAVHVDTPQGHAGEAAQQLGVWAYPIFLFIPLLFVAVFFAIVPLGNPFDASIRGQAVFVFVTNLAVTAAISYLYAIAYSGMSGYSRPFRVSVVPMVVVIVIQLAIMLPIYLTRGVRDLLGILAVGLCVVGVYATLALTRPEERKKVWHFFLHFQVPLLFHISALTLYMIAYRSASAVVQGILVFALNLFTFIFRRIMLSLLDAYPLELTMLLSGLWIQSLADVVQAFSFPQVSNPKVFAAVWVAQSFGNIALLLFVSDVWIFKLRPVIKTYVVNAFKGNFPIPPIPEPDYTFKPEDRGHSANVGSYRRRQFRFWIWKVVSQAVAQLSYLVLSPILRFGLNKERFPFGPSLPIDGWRNSMVYAGVELDLHRGRHPRRLLCAVQVAPHGVPRGQDHPTPRIPLVHVRRLCGGHPDPQHHPRAGDALATLLHFLIV